MIRITDAAVQHLKTLVQEHGDASKGLRISVESGGCAGMQYEMSIDEPQADDHVAERDGVRVLINPASAAYLRGSEIDYADELAGAGFRIHNPNAVRSCGCGTSFESTAPQPPQPPQQQAAH